MGYPYVTLIAPIGTSSAGYTANQVIGTGVVSLTPVPSNGFIQGVTITAKSTVTSQIDVMFFRSSMANTTFTDASSIAISSQDAGDMQSVVSVTNWAYGGTAASVGTANGLAYRYSCGSGERQNLFCSVVARGALTLNSTSDLAVAVTIVS